MTQCPGTRGYIAQFCTSRPKISAGIGARFQLRIEGRLAGQREGRITNLRLGTCRQHHARVATVNVPYERRVDVVAEKFLQPFR